MSEPIAGFALGRTRDRISGPIGREEGPIREAKQDPAHINGALRLFDVSGEAADLWPCVDLNRPLRSGEKTKICKTKGIFAA